jgi:hypothetical protein
MLQRQGEMGFRFQGGTMSQTSIKMADMRGSVVYHSVARNSCMEIGSQFCNYVFEYTKKSFIPAFKLEPHPCVLFFHYHNNHHSIWLSFFIRTQVLVAKFVSRFSLPEAKDISTLAHFGFQLVGSVSAKGNVDDYCKLVESAIAPSIQMNAMSFAKSLSSMASQFFLE